MKHWVWKKVCILFTTLLIYSNDLILAQEHDDLCRLFPHLCDLESRTSASVTQRSLEKNQLSKQKEKKGISSSKPSIAPSFNLFQTPSVAPTSSPTESPTKSHFPSLEPTTIPTKIPTELPSLSPSLAPTDEPSSELPSLSPSLAPTDEPSSFPSESPSTSPTISPSGVPTYGPRPNLIMILTDEHNIRTLGCYRNVLKGEQKNVWGDGIQVETPNIDKIAADGALFTNFYTVGPLCTPSRASFMSGLYPQNTGDSIRNHGRMNDDVVTFAKVLKEQRGYYTGYIGKWHLNGEEKPGWGNSTRKFGFEDTKYQFNRGHWKFLDETNGTMKEFGFYKSKRFKGREEKHFTTDYLFDRSIDFMETAKSKNEPFAFVLSIPDPHAPNQVRAPYDDMFKDLHFELPKTAKQAVKKNPAPPKWNFLDHLNVPLDDADTYLKEYENSFHYQNHLQQYFGMVKCIDDNVGKLMDYLTGEGIDQETIVVLTSDHGDLLGEHGKLNKGRPFRTSGGIPFILRFPAKVVPGKQINSALSSVDFAPSILSLMNVEDHGVEFDGEDFSHELTNGFLTTDYPRTRFIYDVNDVPLWAGVIMRNLKLVISEFDIPWLFDLKADPSETINFFDKSGYEKQQEALLEDIFQGMIKHNIPLAKVANYIFWNKPACLDSRDQILINSKSYFCDDIGSTLSSSICKEKKLRKHCLVTCNSCCKDSVGKMWVFGELLQCKQLKNVCNQKRVKQFCPKTCGECK